MSEKKYRRVEIVAGPRGWGGPLIIEPRPGKDLIYSVTGGGIHPVAQHIADLTGGTPFDGFRSKRDFDEIAVAVIDCGGTARVGVYPMKGVLTVDIYPTKPSGPLFRFIKEDNFVSGVGPDQVRLLDGEGEELSGVAAEETAAASDGAEPVAEATAAPPNEPKPAAPPPVEEGEAQDKKKGFLGRLFGR